MEKEEIQKEEVTSKKDSEESAQETKEEKTSKETPQEDLSAKAKELEEKNKQLFERAKKAEEKLKELKPQSEEKTDESEEDKTTSQNPRDIVRLAKALEGFSDEEINFIYRNAKSQELDSIVEATKDEWVLDSINTRREKVAKENKIPESGNVQGGESKIKGLTVEEINEDPESHRKAFQEFMKTGKTTEEGI